MCDASHDVDHAKISTGSHIQQSHIGELQYLKQGPYGGFHLIKLGLLV